MVCDRHILLLVQAGVLVHRRAPENAAVEGSAGQTSHHQQLPCSSYFIILFIFIFITVLSRFVELV
jgi:hypothetical protein